ncbi:MAG: YebC/PmpR family DNA-binding transcriptional regulator [Candidatus Wildermuthbacteria bacterium]|nr:YebC/PmpR family DNA-binding transcriptional regulator [Candidatus Wildermuthbacteria bacterium]
MSGHSHWAGIKHQKGIADAKRSKLFSRISKEISMAARSGGDIAANPRLRSVVEKAKEANMPSDNIAKAIKKGSGEEAGAQLEEILVEAYGPSNSALIVSAITDNKNRTIGEIKQIIAKYNGKIAEGGAVRWMFERKGVITLNLAQSSLSKEDIELSLIEAGAEDIYWQEQDKADAYSSPTDLDKLKISLQEKGFAVESATLDWVPKERLSLSRDEGKSLLALFEALDEQDDVQDIYSNIKLQA